VNRSTLTRLSRAATFGALIGVAAPLALGTFLVYTGLAIANASAQWVHSVPGDVVGRVVGALAFVLWILLVFGVPALCGGLLGEAVHRMRGRRRDV
jgi:hypothetical protein